MKSIWLENFQVDHREKLQGDIAAEVAVVGGGMAGVLIAHQLKARGISCVLVESGRIGMGITKNTTAKITAQHNLIYHQLTGSAGEEKARQYLQANLAAVTAYRALCKNIDCDFSDQSAFVYSLKNRRKLEEEVAAVQNLGFAASFTEKTALPFPVAGAVEFPNQAQFNPLKFIRALAAQLTIYEDTAVISVEDNIVQTDYGKITAQTVVIASHFPFVNAPGYYFARMYQQRSYVVALKNAPPLTGMYIDESEDGFSLRSYDDLLLVGGGGHRTGKQGGGYDQVRKFVRQTYPHAQEKCCWATQDCMTLDKIPYIGQFSRVTPNTFVATGFNKWGMTTSMVSSMLLADQITGQKNEFAEVFSPQRMCVNKQFFINGAQTVTSLLSLRTKRCSHLGCTLVYNRQEHSWDCPCHGSRFAEDGSLIDNPARKGLKH